MAYSRYKGWFRNLHFRRAWLLIAYPLLLPIVLVLEAISSLPDHWRDAKKAWQPEVQPKFRDKQI
jgi:hypothetical protein